MHRKLAYILLVIFSLFLSSCATKMSTEADNAEQQKVKKQVLQLLEEEYNQPFKIESFNYKYETHYPSGNCMDCRIKKYGTYHFQIQAVDNPIIELEFNIDDENKESIKDVVDSFKKDQLKELYCNSLRAYYRASIIDKIKVEQPNTKLGEKFCSNRGQAWYQEYKDYYLKHKDEYK
ncbi:hypothetical protein [Francisella philomiragia]|uniref:Lipoprotein n=1 Tax=Francisella philomiragia TaxID=28110 RepID=A0ABS1GA85_9GAMM|nr:hypothetical protein [Francisella philomiragia]MBK2258023.1 hypothetical protein [Francisella philomiragia]MBK2267217.1 hypothetical protein [Francisella philomiragia]MBK2278770.1 hypothetical protein [Francisella philomiragia]MBK2286624.1 hypothetical protein [Francisella philomiragia]MBK2288502.1 hypothetical protein [Francisella philomiragia]